MRLRFELHNPHIIDELTEQMRTIDALLLPHGFVTDLPNLDLFTDSWMCLVANENSRVGDEITMEQLAELPRVLTYHSPSAFTPAARQLQMLGIEPHVQIVVESFLALPAFLVGTDRIALVQARLARLLTMAGPAVPTACGTPGPGHRSRQMTRWTSWAAMLSIARSATAAIVIDGLQAPVVPGIKAPSSTYRPGCSCTLPSRSHTEPIGAPPSGCQVLLTRSLVSVSVPMPVEISETLWWMCR